MEQLHRLPLEPSPRRLCCVRKCKETVQPLGPKDYPELTTQTWNELSLRCARHQVELALLRSLAET